MLRAALFLLLATLCTANAGVWGVAVSGGTVIGRADAKHYVRLVGPDTKCGGSIIGKRFVLTAVHCNVRQGLVKMLTYGANRSLGVHYEATVAGVAQMNYQRTADLSKDLALLHFDQDIPLGWDDMGLISLATETLPIPSMFSVIGYGRESSDGDDSELLKQAFQLSNECTRNAAGNPAVICAKPLATGEQWGAVCAGDSGGGAVHFGKLVGVLSAHESESTDFRQIGCTRESEAYYTSVVDPKNRKWIDEALKGFGSSLEKLSQEYDAYVESLSPNSAPRFSTKRFHIQFRRGFRTKSQADSFRRTLQEEQRKLFRTVLVKRRYQIRSIQGFVSESSAETTARALNVRRFVIAND